MIRIRSTSSFWCPSSRRNTPRSGVSSGTRCDPAIHPTSPGGSIVFGAFASAFPDPAPAGTTAVGGSAAGGGAPQPAPSAATPEQPAASAAAETRETFLRGARGHAVESAVGRVTSSDAA